MEKLIIDTEKDIKTLTLCINGKDCVLEIDRKDVALCSCLVNMCSAILDIQKKYAEIDIDGTTDVEVLKEFANEALAISDKFYEDFCKLFPQFQKATNGVCIRSFDIWKKIMFSISNLLEVQQEKETEKKIKKAIADEVNEEL